MKTLRIFTLLTAFLIGAGEIARWWGEARFVPLVFDELIVAAAMIAAAVGARRWGAAPLAAGWGAFCGLILSLLIPTLDHLLWGPEKESAIFYGAVLSAMLLAGIWAVLRALRLTRPAAPE